MKPHRIISHKEVSYEQYALIWLTVVKSKNVSATLFFVGNADACKSKFGRLALTKKIHLGRSYGGHTLYRMDI